MRRAVLVVFALAAADGRAQSIALTRADLERGWCREIMGEAWALDGWGSLRKVDGLDEVTAARARKNDRKFWRLSFADGLWIPVPLGEIGVFKDTSQDHRLSSATFANRDHAWMMSLTWLGPADDLQANRQWTEQTVVRFKAGLDRVGHAFDCDQADRTAVSLATEEMNAVGSLLDVGMARIHVLGEKGVLSERMFRPRGSEWTAIFYPTEQRDSILRVTWNFFERTPFEGADLPLALVSTGSGLGSAPAPDWADRFARAMQTRDAAMLRELARANGWRSASLQKLNQVESTP